MTKPRLPPLEVSPELIEGRIREVVALNRLCHSLAEFGKTLPTASKMPEPADDKLRLGDEG